MVLVFDSSGILYLEEFVSCCKALFAGVAGQPACTVVKVGVGGSNRLHIALYHFFEFDFGERSGGVGSRLRFWRITAIVIIAASCQSAEQQQAEHDSRKSGDDCNSSV